MDLSMKSYSDPKEEGVFPSAETQDLHPSGASYELGEMQGFT